MALRARPTLSNPKVYTSLSHLTALGSGNSDYYLADGGGQDVYISIPVRLNRPLEVKNFRNAVIVGLDIFNAHVYNPNDHHSLLVKSFTGTCHIEGCLINSNINGSDCLANYDSAGGTIIVQNCRHIYPGYYDAKKINAITGVKPAKGAHGDCIHLQHGRLNYFYVENFVGITYGQGFQLPAQNSGDNLPTKRAEFKNVNLRHVGPVDYPDRSPRNNTFPLLNIGNSTPYGQYNDIFIPDGADFDNFQIDYRTSGVKTVAAQIWNPQGDLLIVSNDLVRWKPAKITGSIYFGTTDFAPETKVGLNYSRSYFDGVNDDTVYYGTIGLRSDYRFLPKGDVSGKVDLQLVAPPLPPYPPEFDTGLGTQYFGNIFFNSEFTFSPIAVVIPPENPNDDGDNDGNIDEEEYYIPPIDVVPPTPFGAPVLDFDVQKIYDPLPLDDLKKKFSTNRRPKSSDYYQLIDTLNPVGLEGFKQQANREGLVYLDRGDFDAVYVGAEGQKLLNITTTAEFQSFTSVIVYTNYASAESWLHTNYPVQGSAQMKDTPIITLDQLDTAGRYDSIHTNFYVDRWGRVTDTTVNSTALGWTYSATISSTAAFSKLKLIDNPSLWDSISTDFMFGPFKFKKNTQIDLRIGHNEAGVATSNYTSFFYETFDNSITPGIGSGIRMKTASAGTRFYIRGSVNKLPNVTASDYTYKCEGTTIGDLGACSVFNGNIKLTDNMGCIQLIASAAAALSAGSDCMLFVAAKKGRGLPVAPEIYEKPPSINKVFAWNMITANDPYTSSPTVETYKAQIEDAQLINLDGFGCEMFGNGFGLTNHIKLIQAAQTYYPNFLLFPIIGIGEWTEANIKSTITNFHNSSVGFKKDGKLVVGVYRADTQAKTYWSKIKNDLSNQGIQIHYLLNITSMSVANIAAWEGIYDTVMNFSVQQGVTASTDLAKTFYTAGIPYVHGFAPSYWINPSSLNKYATYWEKHAGEGISQNYQTIINEGNSDFHLMVTWNDFGEDSYWYANTTVPRSFYQSDIPIRTHRGFGKLAYYYNEWYKTKVMPPIDDEFMVISYRPHSYTATAPTSSDRINLWSQGLTLNPSGEIEDSIYVTTVLDTPGTIEVAFRGVVTTAECDSGINHMRVPYTAAASAKPSLTFYRENYQLAYLEGTMAISEVATSTRNFNYYSDYKQI